MDGSTFDRLTRTLTMAGSRRGALRGVLAGGFGLLGSGTENAAAKKKKPCPPCKKRKKGKCKASLPDGTGCAGGTCQSGNCRPTPPPLCPQLAAPHWCASANTCVPACPGGSVFDPASCTCGCTALSACCQCQNGACFQGPEVATFTACQDRCRSVGSSDLNWESAQGATYARTVVCSAEGRCTETCGADTCGAANACTAVAECAGGGQCFQPDGGGPSRCGDVAADSCGYTSHQQCADAFGQGAFLVRFTPNDRCTCGEGSPSSTFCAIPA